MTTNSSVKFNVRNSGLGYNTLLEVDQNLAKAFVVKDNGATTPAETFVVSGNGFTQIRIPDPNGTPVAFTVTDISNPADGINGTVNFKVKTNGHVYAREVEIVTGTFPDYVFDKNYKRLTLIDLEAYTKLNHRLPGFQPEKYYVDNGMKTGELIVLHQEKIEEGFLYMIEMNKEIERLKAENEKLKKEQEAYKTEIENRLKKLEESQK
jgi:hypothetical protein